MPLFGTELKGSTFRLPGVRALPPCIAGSVYTVGRSPEWSVRAPYAAARSGTTDRRPLPAVTVASIRRRFDALRGRISTVTGGRWRLDPGRRRHDQIQRTYGGNEPAVVDAVDFRLADRRRRGRRRRRRRQ